MTSFAKVLSKPFQSKTNSQNTTPSVRDGRMSFSSDTSTVVNVELPESSYKVLPKYTTITEDDVLDPEDQAWGSPPASTWSLPKFTRRATKTRSS